MFFCPAAGEIGGKGLGQRPRIRFAFRGSRVVPCQLREIRQGHGRTGRRAGQRHRFGTELTVVLRQQRQVQQPFAGIVDDVEMQLAAPELAGEKEADSYSMVSRSSDTCRVDWGQIRSFTSASTCAS